MSRLALRIRIALYSSVLMLLCAVALATVALQPLGSLSQEGAQARAQRVADSVAARIQQALALGIPLSSLEGVDALFDQRLAESAELHSLDLRDAAGQVRWQRQQMSAKVGGLAEQAMQVESAVRVGGDVQATVRVQVRTPTWGQYLRQWAPGLLALAGLTALLAAQIGLPHQRWRRDRLVADAARRIATGDFAARLPVPRRQAFDQRLPWLSAQLRDLREQHRRVLRLAQSLRQTEPDAARRLALDQAVVDAVDRADFSDGAGDAPQPGNAPQRSVSLKTRVTLLVLLTGVVLGLGFAGVWWQRDQRLDARYHASVRDAQGIAWAQGRSDALHDLQTAVQRLIADPAWAGAWREQDKLALAGLVEPVLAGHVGWRVDVYDDRRNLVYSSSLALRQDALMDAGWLQRTLADGAPAAGLSQVSRDRYALVAASRFALAGGKGVVAVGLDAASLLPELASTLGGDAFLLNLRGHDVAGTGRNLIPAQGLELPVREARVMALRGAQGQHVLASVQPLQGPDQRQVGALLLLRDISAESRADQVQAGLAVLGGLAFLLLLGALVFAYLRHALAPLERSVGVLGALSRGDLRAAPDDADEVLPDEAGQIARGVATLRGEMLNLQMLREERIRIRQQQEQLIRRQLKQLAESLEEDARAEVLAALDQKGGHNELADLAHILGRLSGLVTHQQDRLIDLLRELRAAMAQQAQLISLQQELEIARQMQLSILPRVTPLTRAVDVAALMVPAKEIGGDFYDYFMLDGQHLALVVADVSGKGVPAAFFMAISRTLLKANALFLREPARIMAQLNDQLCAENEQMMFVTVFLGILDVHSGGLTFVNAGHNPPLLRHADGTMTVLPHGKNMALAVMDGIPYTENRLSLQPGDTLLLYTDGVTEATSVDGALMGEAALTEVVRSHAGDNQGLPEAVLQAVRVFERGAAQADDITCVSIRFRGAEAQASRAANMIASA